MTYRLTLICKTLTLFARESFDLLSLPNANRLRLIFPKTRLPAVTQRFRVTRGLHHFPENSTILLGAVRAAPCRNELNGTRQSTILRSMATQAASIQEAIDSEKQPSKSSTIKSQVSHEELVTLMNNGGGLVTLIDVREPDELQQSGSLPNCINIPVTKLKAALMLSEDEFVSAFKCSKIPKDGSGVIFYGLTSVRSSAAVELAHKLGYKKARHYPGGMEEWNSKIDTKKT